MPITNIDEIDNPVRADLDPIQENQDRFIPNIENEAIPNRNGFVSIYTGSGGSGKSSLILNMVTNKTMYHKKFDNIFYICPESSFCSVVNHPFKDHDKVFHELTVGLLEEIYTELIGIVTEREALKDELKEKKKKRSLHLLKWMMRR